MKLNKKKVFTLALAVCLIAILSMSTLAWFTDDDHVTNDFHVAGSDEDDPDDIFSVDVWETDEDGKEYDETGIKYEEILPGDTFVKNAFVENTGAYDEYIRVKITVSDAYQWQKAYGLDIVPVTEFVNVDLNALYGMGSYLEGDTFAYYLYYNQPLHADETYNIFTEAYIPEELTREQAAAMVDGFTIDVKADAVQTEHVGANVYEAFKTVGMEVPVNTLAATVEELEAALLGGETIVLTANLDLSALNNGAGIDIPVDAAVVINGNGNTIKLGHTAFNHYNNNLEGLLGNTSVKFENVVFEATSAGQGYVVCTGFDFTGSVEFENCTFKYMYTAVYVNQNASGTPSTLVIKNCDYVYTQWGYGVDTYTSMAAGNMIPYDQQVTVTFEGNTGIDDAHVRENTWEN